MFLLFVLVAAQVDFIVGTFLGPKDDEKRAKGFLGYSGKPFVRHILSGTCGLVVMPHDC